MACDKFTTIVLYLATESAGAKKTKPEVQKNEANFQERH